MSNPLEITQGRSEYNNPSNFFYIFESFDNVDQLLETYKLEREALFDKLKDLGFDYNNKYDVNYGLTQGNYDKLTSFDKAIINNGDFINPSRLIGKGQYSLEKPIDKYSNSKVFKQFKQLYDECLLDFDFAGAFTKQKIEITDRQNGVFDFSLASQGLYRPVEYFSEELESKYPNEFEYLDLPSGLIPPDLINNTPKQGGGKVFWYVKRENGKEEQFLCEQRQLGSTEVLINNPKSKLVKAKNGLLYAEPSTAKNGEYRVEFKTRNKRSYLTYFKEGGGKARYVDLYIPINLICRNDIKDLIYIMPSLILAEQLEKAGTKTKVSFFRSNYEQPFCYGFNVGIKDYGQPLDLAKIALYGTGANKDWIFTDYINSWYTTKKQNQVRGSGFWGGTGNTTYTSPRFLTSTIKRFFNYISTERKGDSYSKAQEMKLSIWASTIECRFPSDWLTETKKEYNSKGSSYDYDVDRRETFDLIKVNTYLALDRLSFAMRNGYTTAEMIGERMKREKKYTNKEIRDYIRDVMIQAYEYPTDSNYPTPIKEQEIINSEYEQCLEEAIPYLQTLK